FDLTDVSSDELLSGRHRDQSGHVTVAAATDGNHGRSVAWGAQIFGCHSRIYLHSHVGRTREREIAKYGADIVRIEGSYDDSVRQCALDADANGWHLVADTTAGGGREDLPRLVMQGYTILVQEVLDQMPNSKPPTHIFVPGGVGGIAAAVAAHVGETFDAGRPRVVVVEPDKADCILRSIASDKLTAVEGELDTFMACLSAGEVSPLAWPVIRHQVDDVLSVPDEAAVETMRLLAGGVAGDQAVVAGESGVAAMAGIIAASLDPELRQALELSQTSSVVAIGTEGATDAEAYEQVVGKPAHLIEAA
ncbi:MAG: diaminopropionate ammonia-lyase, partial [Aestuariivirgaceae bacterium]